MGAETFQNLKNMKTLVGGRPHVDRKNANWWRNVYDAWDDRFYITHENINFILNRIQPYVGKTPRNNLPTRSQAVS